MRNLFPLLLCLPLAACVGKGKYDDALAQLADCQASLEDTSQILDACRSELAVATTRGDDLEANLMNAQRQAHVLERERDDYRGALENTRAMLQERGAEREALMARLAELEVIEAEERERNRIYRSFIERFQAQIDAGQLEVAIVRGRLVLQLPQDILFASGSATLGPDGTTTLREIAGVLATFDDRFFQVEGHTDNVPIATRQFPSNWELSSARALAVVRILIEGGVAPGRVSGAGFGEFQPRASNDTPEQRALNRRIEIVMMPNLDVFSDSPVQAPQAPAAPPARVPRPR